MASTVIKTVEVSNHAAQRYAERIADRESLSDINIYVQRNMEKITDDINKMLAHSAFLYCGKIGSKDKNIVNVYLSGTWILLLDRESSKVITLYKVEFNVGEEFNKQFVQLMLKKLGEHSQQYENKKLELSSVKENYVKIIRDNEEQIAEYRTMIRKLEKLNKDYEEVVEDLNTECDVLELQIKRDVEDLIKRW